MRRFCLPALGAVICFTVAALAWNGDEGTTQNAEQPGDTTPGAVKVVNGNWDTGEDEAFIPERERTKLGAIERRRVEANSDRFGSGSLLDAVESRKAPKRTAVFVRDEANPSRRMHE